MQSFGDKGVHIFLNSINTKVNVIAQVEIDIIYFNISI